MEAQTGRRQVVLGSVEGSGDDRGFVPLGQGTSQIAACIRALQSRGFSGWMMIEHETPYAKDLGARVAIQQDLDYVKSVL